MKVHVWSFRWIHPDYNSGLAPMDATCGASRLVNTALAAGGIYPNVQLAGNVRTNFQHEPNGQSVRCVNRSTP
jgi:hypothetical protein